MWKVNKLQDGTFEIRHENGKQATQVKFSRQQSAQNMADHYNAINLGFCPECGTSQAKGLICFICAAEMLRKNPGVLNKRLAHCIYHADQKEPSIIAYEKEAFFEYRPNHQTDIYYCGCRGWN